MLSHARHTVWWRLYDQCLLIKTHAAVLEQAMPVEQPTSFPKRWIFQFHIQAFWGVFLSSNINSLFKHDFFSIQIQIMSRYCSKNTAMNENMSRCCYNFYTYCIQHWLNTVKHMQVCNISFCTLHSISSNSSGLPHFAREPKTDVFLNILNMIDEVCYMHWHFFFFFFWICKKSAPASVKCWLVLNK